MPFGHAVRECKGGYAARDPAMQGNPCSRNMRNLPARIFAVRNRGNNADNHKMNCKPSAEAETAQGYAEAQRDCR